MESKDTEGGDGEERSLLRERTDKWGGTVKGKISRVEASGKKKKRESYKRPRAKLFGTTPGQA